MEILYYFLSISGIATALIYIGKLIITKSFDAGLERYKSDLVKGIEEHKSDLSKIQLEHQIRFSKLHEQRAEVIKLLFSEVIILEGLLIKSTTFSQDANYMYDVQRDKDARSQIRELINLFDENKIYFSQSTVTKFEAIFKESWEIVSQMAKVRQDGAEVANYVKQQQLIPEKYLRYDDLWNKAFYRATGEFKSLKEDLANEFRSLLGIV